MKPVIAITARRINESEYGRYFVNGAYIEKLTASGAFPLVVTPKSMEDIDDILDHVDGLLVTGGEDVHSSLYHEEMHVLNFPIHPSIEEMDVAIIKKAIEKHVPMMGICRGIQIINVAMGGTLYQDIPTQHPSTTIHNQVVKAVNYIHEVSFDDEVLESIYGKTHMVNSFHHQAVKDVADGLRVVASAPDGLIEAVRGENILAVQWHPEGLKDEESFKLFDYFVNTMTKK